MMASHAARKRRVVQLDRAVARDRTGDGRHVRLVPIGADPAAHHLREVHAVDVFEEAVHEMAPGLLAVGDAIDAGALLLVQRDAHRVAFRVVEFGTAQPPLRPELFRFREPGWFGEAACDRRADLRPAQTRAFPAVAALASRRATSSEVAGCGRSRTASTMHKKPNGVSPSLTNW